MQALTPAQLATWLAVDAGSEATPAERLAPPVLLDVREPWEFELARIEGAKLVPMQQLATEWQRLDSQAPTVVICHHGVRSAQVAHFLHRAGFEQVFNLEGGLAAWAEQVDTSMPRY